MSGLISSLLIKAGIRSPDLPPPNDHPGSHLNESISSDNRLPFQLDRSCEQKSFYGDAGVGSLHSPPFFTPLPKDMDARNLQGTPLVTHSTPEPDMTTDGSSDTIANISAHPVDSRNSASHSGEALTQHAPQDSTSAEDVEGARGITNNAFDLDGMAQSSLPADDGMSVLRRKIIAIRDLQLANAEKARMVHDLMNHNASRDNRHTPEAAALPAHKSPLISPPTSLRAHQDLESHAPEPESASLDHTSPSPFGNVFHLTPEDTQPTYVPRTEPELEESIVIETVDEDMDTEELAMATLGCVHYHRNVKLECYTCKKWYTCRFCHDEVEDHALIRRDTENMLCMLCGHPQPAGQVCRQCDEQAAQYYCEICKLWDNDGKKSIYHCDDCGICRIGQGLGKDFFHCQTCSVCLPISIENTHRCIERSTQCDCPICGDYMFTSPDTVVVMRCGHSIHSKCLTEYSRNSFRCPICSKTITNMESTFRNLDRTIESQPMPVEFKDTKGLVYCNDCGVKSVVKYHWLGLKCDLCESYNTAQLRILQGDMSAQLELGQDTLPRARSSSLIEPDESMSSSLAELGVNNAPIPRSPLSVPNAPENRQSSPYNITRGRAISPVVSNYFGLPTERESEKPSSMPFFGSQARGANENDYGALNFLSKKFTYPYGFFGGDAKAADTISEAGNEEDDAESSDSAESAGSRANDEEEEDDDYLDIFGHR